VLAEEGWGAPFVAVGPNIGPYLIQAPQLLRPVQFPTFAFIHEDIESHQLCGLVPAAGGLAVWNCVDTDAELVSRSRSDPSVFEILVHRHGQAVHAYLLRRSSRQTADELLTEVWLRAFRARGSYNTRWPNARPWLYGIARNTMRAHQRSRLASPGEPNEPIVDPWPDVDSRLDAQRQRARLRQSIASVPDDDREVLLLVAWEHLSPAEAALALGVPQGTARSRLHRARAFLKQQFQPDLIEVTTPRASEA